MAPALGAVRPERISSWDSRLDTALLGRPVRETPPGCGVSSEVLGPGVGAGGRGSVVDLGQEGTGALEGHPGAPTPPVGPFPGGASEEWCGNGGHPPVHSRGRFPSVKPVLFLVMRVRGYVSGGQVRQVGS